MDAEDEVKKLAELLEEISQERNLYLKALMGIVKDYETIGYQTDCILAMWSKAKRALDGGISTKREPGGDGTDLGGGVRT